MPDEWRRAAARRRTIEWLKSHPALYRRTRAVGEVVADRLPPRRWAEITGPVHHSDTMLANPVLWERIEYEQTGWHTAAFLRELPGTAAGPVLDFGCGYGRVTRHLAAQLPGTPLEVHDLDPRAVGFCVRRFGARAMTGGPYQVAWLGSVVTHLPASEGEALLRRLAGQLVPGGHLAFSTAGETKLAQLDPWAEDQRPAIDRQLTSVGAAYLPYPHHEAYGLTWHTAAATEALIGRLGLTLVEHREGAWSHGQDLWVARG